jgi:hypothetical protein
MVVGKQGQWVIGCYASIGCYTAMGGSDTGAVFGSEQNFSKEVDDKANSYFQAIYNRGMSVDRLLDELKRFKDSQIKRERVS